MSFEKYVEITHKSDLIHFVEVPKKFLPYVSFYGYETHVVSKHYIFKVFYKPINRDTDREMMDEIRRKSDINNPYRNVEYLFDNLFSNIHIFIVPTNSYRYLEYNTKTRMFERKVVSMDEIVDVDEKLFDYSYSQRETISVQNHVKLERFERNDKPIYFYLLPEEIVEFNFMYSIYGHYGNEHNKIFAMSDNYIYEIYTQR